MKTKLLLAVVLLSQWHFTSFGAGAPEKWIAHEWGTFTSVQGSEGVQLEWNPFTVTELPRFVYDRNRPNSPEGKPIVSYLSAKSAFRTLQRMETPVIYFYTDKERTVDVAVKFPQGMVTEWYPRVTAFGPVAGQIPEGSPWLKESLVRWDKLQVLPVNSKAGSASVLPMDKSGSHYYAARETDAALVKMAGDGRGKPDEFDKFLFYRGVGNFTAPLQASMPGSGEHFLQLKNQGGDNLRHLFILQVKNGQAKFTRQDSLTAGQESTIRLEPDKGMRPLAEVTADISRAMSAALVAEGLFAREAEAMVATWRDSWFQEPGVRVLYTLPRAWTDRVLPLDVKPAPAQVERVFVGRAELITPAAEFALLKQVVRYADATGASRPGIVEQTRQLGLGRFAEPTVRRVSASVNNREFSTAAWDLLQAAYGGSKNATAGRFEVFPAPSVAAKSQFE